VVVPITAGTTHANGAAIRAIRQRTELTIVDLVARLAEAGVTVHPDHISNIELGRKQPSYKLLGAIARALDVPKAALIGAPPRQPAGAR
jgi:transcriptional regulator with XRE-family HTH domain